MLGTLAGRILNAGTIVPIEAAKIKPVRPFPELNGSSPKPTSFAKAAIIGTSTATRPDADGIIKAREVPIQKTP